MGHQGGIGDRPVAADRAGQTSHMGNLSVSTPTASSAHLKHSQAMRDWVRATRDLHVALSQGASVVAIADAALVVDRAQARVRSLARLDV
jgi:hypothetical protein